MTFPVVLGIVATLFTLAAGLGSAIAVLRSSNLKATVEVQAGTIAALEKARTVDRDESARHKEGCQERIAALEGRAAGLEGLVAAGIADAVATAVVAALRTDLDRRATPRPRTRAPRKAAP